MKFTKVLVYLLFLIKKKEITNDIGTFTYKDNIYKYNIEVQQMKLSVN